MLNSLWPTKTPSYQSCKKRHQFFLLRDCLGFVYFAMELLSNHEMKSEKYFPQTFAEAFTLIEERSCADKRTHLQHGKDMIQCLHNKKWLTLQIYTGFFPPYSHTLGRLVSDSTRLWNKPMIKSLDTFTSWITALLLAELTANRPASYTYIHTHIHTHTYTIYRESEFVFV